MMNIHYTCKCSTSQTKESITPLHCHPNISSCEKKDSKICKSLFLIQKGSVKYQNSNKFKDFSKENQIKKCSNRINANENKKNLEKVQSLTKFQNRSVKGLSNLYINEEKLNYDIKIINNEYIDEDTDFELMFSNKSYPIVGSYKNHLDIPIDISSD